ncbi:MAG: TIGR03032 family protein [Bacteroidota bacterium]
MASPLPPFACIHSPAVPELLKQLNCTIAISTYQAGKLIFISSIDGKKLVQLPRNFTKPMGIFIDNHGLSLATESSIIEFENAVKMAPNLPGKKNTYDAFFLPRVTYHTGALDVHDLHKVNGDLIAVNTIFSCLSRITSRHSFEPFWKPNFIEKISPTDDCHLNGLAIAKNKIKYVSALGSTNTPEGWRKDKLTGGVIIDVDSGEIVSSGLSMPHSPRLYDNELYCLVSAKGELIKINTNSGDQKVIKSFNGFLRGMDKIGDYLFIGLSKIRKKSEAFGDLPIAPYANQSGIVILHLPTCGVVGSILYQNSVEEIYDVKLLKGHLRPYILNTEKDAHKTAVTSSVGDFWAIKPNES